MKISSRIDGSIRGAILSSWQPSLSSPPPSLSRLGGGGAEGARRGRERGPAASRTNIFGHAQSDGVASSRRFFGSITSTSPFGICDRKAKTLLRPKVLSHPHSRRTSLRCTSFFRSSAPMICENHTAAAVAPPDPPPEPLPTTPPPSQIHSKDKLLGFVDQQGEGRVEDHFNFYSDPYLRGYAPADGPNLVVSDRKEDAEFPSPDQVRSGDEDEHKIIQSLRRAIVWRLRRPGTIHLDTIYHIYQQLPEPRMSHLPAKLRHGLLRVLGQPEKRNSKSMLRYFAVVADVKNSGLPLLRSEWNYAIAFAARYVGTSSGAETESALSLWSEMERDAGIQGNAVTFNILFDVASKSGHFALAEMIYKEMESRGYAYNRYHYISLIHFFGLKYDTDGVRAAYREMVEAGEMIDTVVLNCVISGLLRSGEENAAERVYERMKATSPKIKDMPQRTYATNKMVTQALMMFAKIGRQHPPMRQSFQASTPVAPDLQTYRLLINHYGVKVGDLAKVAQYLDEMKFFQIEIHGAIFLALFKSFHNHGGYPGSAWSLQRLDSIWTAMLRALDEPVSGLTIETWLAIWVLRAFMKCSSRKRVLETYEALESRWHLCQADKDFVLDSLHKILDRPGL